MSDVERLAEALAAHQRMIRPGGLCWCGEWPQDRTRRDTWMDHVAERLAPLLAEVRAEALAEGERRGGVKALREAADEIDGDGHWWGDSPTARWLRDRAAALVSGRGAVGEDSEGAGEPACQYCGVVLTDGVCWWCDWGPAPDDSPVGKAGGAGDE